MRYILEEKAGLLYYLCLQEPGPMGVCRTLRILDIQHYLPAKHLPRVTRVNKTLTENPIMGNQRYKSALRVLCAYNEVSDNTIIPQAAFNCVLKALTQALSTPLCHESIGAWSWG